jgi:hypothetical protein
VLIEGVQAGWRTPGGRILFGLTPLGVASFEDASRFRELVTQELGIIALQ